VAAVAVAVAATAAVVEEVAAATAAAAVVVVTEAVAVGVIEYSIRPQGQGALAMVLLDRPAPIVAHQPRCP
jgi:response regulator of citrate/malate metabolism